MKLSYRPITKDDLGLRHKWLNDSEVNRFLGTRVRQGTDEEFHNNWWKNYLEAEASGEKKFFIVSDGDRPIGQVGLRDINVEDKHGSLYIVIGEKDYRGKGLSQELLKYITDWGFNELGLHKISLEVHADNFAGIRAYEKFGFVQEGILRENIYNDGQYYNEIIMALIKK